MCKKTKITIEPNMLVKILLSFVLPNYICIQLITLSPTIIKHKKLHSEIHKYQGHPYLILKCLNVVRISLWYNIFFAILV